MTSLKTLSTVMLCVHLLLLLVHWPMFLPPTYQKIWQWRVGKQRSLWPFSFRQGNRHHQHWKWVLRSLVFYLNKEFYFISFILASLWQLKVKCLVSEAVEEFLGCKGCCCLCKKTLLDLRLWQLLWPLWLVYNANVTDFNARSLCTLSKAAYSTDSWTQGKGWFSDWIRILSTVVRLKLVNTEKSVFSCMFHVLAHRLILE